MRITNKKYYTKSERKFVRMLQELHIPFKSKIKIKGREIDFIIGKFAIEIDGHSQDPKKNEMLLKQGYHPIHFLNKEITPQIANIILWLAVH